MCVRFPPGDPITTTSMSNVKNKHPHIPRSSIGTPGCSPFSTCDTPGIRSIHIPNRTPSTLRATLYWYLVVVRVLPAVTINTVLAIINTYQVSYNSSTGDSYRLVRTYHPDTKLFSSLSSLRFWSLDPEIWHTCWGPY